MPCSLADAWILSCYVLGTITATPLPNGDDRKLSVQPPSLPKSRMPSQALGSIGSVASTPPFDPRKSLADEGKKKKKKRKRDDVSDAESGE